MNKLDRLIDDYRVPMRLGVWLAALVCVTLLGLWVSSAYAADAQLSWQHPTERVDGTPLPLAEIAQTRINWGLCSGELNQAVDVPAPATTHTLPGLNYGTWCFVARTVDTGGLVSDPTGPVQKVIVAPPKPPGFVTVNVIAYEVRWEPGRATVLGDAVGLIRRGVACGDSVITTKGQRKYHEVPMDMVKLRRLPVSPIVVAECAAS